MELTIFIAVMAVIIFIVGRKRENKSDYHPG